MDNYKNPYYDKSSGLFFTWSTDVNCYEPIGYDAFVDDEGNINYTDITRGTLFYDFVMFIRHSSMIINTVKGTKTPGMLELYQWIIAFSCLKNMVDLSAEDMMVAISRQAGKTFIARKLMAFATVFIPKHKSVPEERYYMTFVCVKKDLLADQCGKLEPEIDKAMESFNMLYPFTPIKQGNV